MGGRSQRNKRKSVPHGAAKNPDPEDHEDKLAEISFRFYDQGLCQISVLQPAAAREGLDSLKRIGSGTVSTIAARNVRTSTVSATGEYTQLFRRLDPGVEKLNHHNIGNGARVFYFLSGGKCHVVAFRNGHFD